MAENASPTAQPSKDSFGIGRTSGQRGAEIFAGLRAELMPSPETVALSRFGGRLVARIFINIGKRLGARPDVTNFLAIRQLGMTEMAVEILKTMTAPLVIVDLAAGFSPRGLYLASRFPDAEIIEIDLPDVVNEKKHRLRAAKNFKIPTNIQWLSADLGTQPLQEVLQGRKAHAMTAEGLMMYFPHEQITSIGHQIYDNLVSGGILVCDMGWRRGQQTVQNEARMLSRQSGRFIGNVDNAEQVQEIFSKSGFEEVEVLLPSQTAERYEGLPRPVADFELFVRARKVAEIKV
jgi:O-methyltransferase involved in polyketide biosynthesis